MYDKLSDSQKPILKKTGKFVVRACPGSGKTYCVAAKVSHLLDNWNEKHKGMAIISFTNTAWQEIEEKCKHDFNKTIDHPHFLGTIDSFINQYIFLPYGNLAMGCEERPTLVGEPHSIWSGGRFERDCKKHFDKCSFDIKGTLIKTDNNHQFGFSWKQAKAGKTNGNVANLEDEKKKLNTKGYANQADANYYAMKVLENPQFKIVLTTLAQRFDWLIIDEAQDTSDIQMRIIDLLIDAGIKNVMIVGDPDQAIFEWNNAKPELFEQKYKEWVDNSMELFESYRSSKLICDVVQKLSLSSKEEKMKPAEYNNVKDYDIKPKIWIYTDKNETIKKFVVECERLNICNKCDKRKHNRVVLARAKTFLNDNSSNDFVKISVDTDNSFTKEFMKGKYYYDTNRKTEGLKILERAYIKILENKEYSIKQVEIDDYIEKQGIIKFRKSLRSLAEKLPKTDTTLKQWIESANKLKTTNFNVDFKINSEANDFTFEQAFPMEDKDFQEEDYRVATIHKVKGETYEAVLVFLKDAAGNRAKYENIFEGIGANKNKKAKEDIEKWKEELRVIYVALSRPRRLLVIAVPNEKSKGLWADKLGIDIT